MIIMAGTAPARQPAEYTALRCVPLVESHSITCSERSTANIGRMHLIAHAKTVARDTYQNCGSAVPCIIVF